VFSPHAEEILPLFDEPNQARNWAGTRRLLANNASDVVGLYTFFVSTRFTESTTNELQQILQSLVPGSIAFTGGTQAPLGDSTAARLDGRLSDPQDGAKQLQFECYIVQQEADDAPPRTVLLFFFSAPSTFNSNRAVFDRIARSVDLSD
jgi:hypothetical protein